MPVGWRGEGALLFGGSGFLGSAILRLFPEMISAGRSTPPAPNRHFAVPDLSDLSTLRDVPFDRVICCIGSSRHVELMDKPLTEALNVHLLPSVHILEQLRQRRLASFVRLSTVLLYEESAQPVDEQSPIAPHRNRYLLSQYLGEQAAHFYPHVATLRLCNLFGSWPGPRTDLVHELATQLRQTGHATIRTRIPQRDFLYVDDAARAVAALAYNGQSGIFNIGAGEAVSAGEIADILTRLSGGTLTCRNEPVHGTKKIQVNSSKLRAATGWKPRHTLEEGLAKTWGAMNAPRH